MDFAHTHLARVRGLDGAPAALGGAITVELCGHWEHQGLCRWPHHTASAAEGDEWAVTVRFNASPADEPDVRRLIDAALARGELTGPDGDLVRWTPVAAG